MRGQISPGETSKEENLSYCEPVIVWIYIQFRVCGETVVLNLQET